MNSKDLPQLYSLTAIGIGTFFGSVLAAGYMLAANYKALGMPKWASYCTYAGIITFLLMAALTTGLTPSLPTAVVTQTIQIVLALTVAHKIQGPMFTSFQSMGGKYFSNWRAIAVGLIVNLVLLCLLIVFVVLFGEAQPAT